MGGSEAFRKNKLGEGQLLRDLSAQSDPLFFVNQVAEHPGERGKIAFHAAKSFELGPEDKSRS